jgi:hypothetical protein
MKNQNEYRIQDTPEYIMVKRINNEENRKNIIEAAKAFAILIGAMFLAIYLFVKILLYLKDHDPLMALADFLWIK